MKRDVKFTSDWFSKSARMWEKYLPPFYADGKAVQWIEVGAYEGRSALWTLDNLLPPGSTVTCVDHFDADYEERFDRNTRGEPRILKFRGEAREVLPILNPVFGGGYVDGAHEEEEVAYDARAVWRILLPGSPLVFDDYGMPSVRLAVDRFLQEQGRAADVVFAGYQLIARKAG